MPLTLKQKKDICLSSKGYEKCRYLSADEQFCLKKTSQKKVIDEEVGDALSEMKENGIDYRNQHVPLGDNCSGYPMLKLIDLGYDV